MSQKKVKAYTNLNKLPLSDGQKRLIIAKSNKLVKLRKKTHNEKKALRVIIDNIHDLGTISLANIDLYQAMLDDYKQSLFVLQELKDETAIVRNEIKNIVLEALKNQPKKAPEPEPAKEATEPQPKQEAPAPQPKQEATAPQPKQEQKMVKFIFTVPEAITLQSHLSTFLKTRPNATKVTIELAADHMS